MQFTFERSDVPAHRAKSVSINASKEYVADIESAGMYGGALIESVQLVDVAAFQQLIDLFTMNPHAGALLAKKTDTCVTGDTFKIGDISRESHPSLHALWMTALSRVHTWIHVYGAVPVTAAFTHDTGERYPVVPRIEDGTFAVVVYKTGDTRLIYVPTQEVYAAQWADLANGGGDQDDGAEADDYGISPTLYHVILVHEFISRSGTPAGGPAALRAAYDRVKTYLALMDHVAFISAQPQLLLARDRAAPGSGGTFMSDPADVAKSRYDAVSGAALGLVDDTEVMREEFDITDDVESEWMRAGARLVEHNRSTGVDAVDPRAPVDAADDPSHQTPLYGVSYRDVTHPFLVPRGMTVAHMTPASLPDYVKTTEEKFIKYIGALLGVPPPLVGQVSDSRYVSNAKMLEDHFRDTCRMYQGVLVYVLRMMYAHTHSTPFEHTLGVSVPPGTANTWPHGPRLFELLTRGGTRPVAQCMSGDDADGAVSAGAPTHGGGAAEDAVAKKALFARYGADIVPQSMYGSVQWERSAEDTYIHPSGKYVFVRASTGTRRQMKKRGRQPPREPGSTDDVVYTAVEELERVAAARATARRGPRARASYTTHIVTAEYESTTGNDAAVDVVLSVITFAMTPDEITSVTSTLPGASAVRAGLAAAVLGGGDRFTEHSTHSRTRDRLRSRSRSRSRSQPHKRGRKSDRKRGMDEETPARKQNGVAGGSTARADPGGTRKRRKLE